jgi:adenosylmethionine-8-amino-7-oxononanoate aminotransferase
VVPPKGYLKAVDEICKEYGVLLIFDEVMCGMGRTGTLHAWQREGVAPDIQAVGKSLAGGHASASGILVGPRIADALYEGSGIFMHGHTYQNHGIACAATLEVQKIIQEYDLVENSHEMGELLLGSLRQQLATHAHVGDIRGIGLFVTVSRPLPSTTRY